jgi:hypothetical protein
LRASLVRSGPGGTLAQRRAAISSAVMHDII